MAYVDSRRLASIPAEICSTRNRLSSSPLDNEKSGLYRRIRALKDEWKRTRRRQNLSLDEPLTACGALAPQADHAPAN
jgi:hypothetical protein